MKIYNNGKVKAWTDGVLFEEQAKVQVANIAGLPFIFKHVAVMPDVHLGKGATVGSVIATKGAIIPAAIGVDIGCFTGDTKVPTLDGNSYSLKELTEKKQEVYIYTCTPKGKIVPAKARAQLTRKKQELMQVVLNNNQTIKCTLDHKFLMRDGTYKEAQDLLPNDSLMPFYSRLDKDGYTVVRHPYSGKEQRAHWMMARAELLGQIPSFSGQKTIIHHKDFNESNNLPSNLEFMGHKDHSRYHRSLVERNEHWQSPAFEEKRIAALRAKANTPEGYQYYVERGTKNIIKYMEENPDHFKNAVKDNGKRGKQYLIKYNKSKKGREKSKEVSNKIYTCEICKRKIKGYAGYWSHMQKHNRDNHKVISVIGIPDIEDVYCLQVENENHNFALSAGVFVHNCGMIAVKTNIAANHLPSNLKDIRNEIERLVPHGKTFGRRDNGAWTNPPNSHIQRYKNLCFPGQYDMLCELYPKLRHDSLLEQFGTLGGGNHFVEICLDEENNVWVMLHSGSRGPGNRMGRFFIEKAKKLMEKYFVDLPDKELAYLPQGEELYNHYWNALDWAQNYAKQNRFAMLYNVLVALSKYFSYLDFSFEETAINCHHNYVSWENHYGENVMVTRKGAVSAREGQLGIVPGSMGAKSYIVRGKGNPLSFNSCSHGAGRTMSRTQAKKTFTVDDHIAATKKVECRKDKDVIDETPGAYKDIDAVMEAQKDLVEVVHTLKQIVCVKG